MHIYTLLYTKKHLTKKHNPVDRYTSKYKQRGVLYCEIAEAS